MNKVSKFLNKNIKSYDLAMELYSRSYYFNVGQITKAEIFFQHPDSLSFCFPFCIELKFFLTKLRKLIRMRVPFLRDICFLTEIRLIKV